MPDFNQLLNEHHEITRRYFLRLGAAGAVMLPYLSHAAESSSELEKAIADLVYFTSQEKFGTVERGKPLPYKQPEEKLKALGMTRDTWQLEVVPDKETDAKLEKPLSKELGTAFDFPALMKLAEKHAVHVPKVMTCNNGASPLGMGLWEGVPLREVIWLTKPRENIRRIYYHGHHNEDPKQIFESSLPIGRVLEDPPGMPPVILCYKLNGRWISGKRGGPVRMLVPEAYGFKSVKWLKKLVLTNLFHANDTYAKQNNDIDSWMKTFARFLSIPKTVQAGKTIPLTGVAQVGISGLKKVQVWVTPQGTKLPENDPYFTKADWQDAEILAPPKSWGGDMPENKLPGVPFGFDAQTNRPKTWPMRYALAHWAVLLPVLPVGKYDFRCRTIDQNGNAQPLPRPFRKSGRNIIQRSTVVVEG